MTDPVKIIVGEGDITEVQVPDYNLIQTGSGGSDGATFFPEVSQEGVISWTNDGGYDNPEPVNIKGPAGNDGNDGNDGQNGVTFTPSVSDAGIISWTNDGDLPNPSPVNIKGSDGEDGEDGVSPVVTFGEITGGHTMTVTDKDHPSGQSINIMDGSGGGGTTDYDDLTNQPSINGTTLSGNKTAAQLGLAAASDIPTVPVQSVNGKTGAVTLTASDVGAGTYSKPSGGIPQTDLASAVQGKLDNTVAISATQPTASENKLWVDTAAGAGTSYQIPTVAEMDAADNTILGNLAMIESSPATAAHAVGEYIVLNGQLYKVTAAIASGQTLTPGTNISAVSGGGLNELASYSNNYNNPTLTTPSEAGITVNSSAVRRKGNLVILYVNVRNANGFPAETWTTIHTLNVRPDTTLSASCAFAGQTATIRLDTNGNVTLYPHGSAFTLFARVIIPFFI